MKFNVTQRDIDNGTRMDANKCAVARSVRRTLGLKQKDVAVTGIEIIVKGKDYLAPYSVSDFVPMFDNHLHVRPFSFELPIRRKAKKAKKADTKVSQAKLITSLPQQEYATV